MTTIKSNSASLILIALSFFLSAIISFNLKAGGGVWVMHLSYQLQDSVQEAYVFGDYRCMYYPGKYLGKELINEEIDVPMAETFNEQFQEHFEGWDSIMVYSRIHDRRILSKHAAFPMQPFLIDQSSGRMIDPSEISKVSLLDVLERSDYAIEVMNLPDLADTSWVGGEFDLIKPLGDDIGCRLEVYDFNKADEQLEGKVHVFAYYYSRTDPLSQEEMEMMEKMLADFKKHKIVVVELCGC